MCGPFDEGPDFDIGELAWMNDDPSPDIQDEGTYGEHIHDDNDPDLWDN